MALSCPRGLVGGTAPRRQTPERAASNARPTRNTSAPTPSTPESTVTKPFTSSLNPTIKDLHATRKEITELSPSLPIKVATSRPPSLGDNLVGNPSSRPTAISTSTKLKPAVPTQREIDRAMRAAFNKPERAVDYLLDPSLLPGPSVNLQSPAVSTHPTAVTEPPTVIGPQLIDSGFPACKAERT
ncbi:MAG: hypothetical protein Q9166_004265 [cf. Caloplaca sp. 2 TL-2023]